MPWLVQTCVVIVTLALVAFVIVAIRAMIRLGRSAVELTTAAQSSMAQVERIARDTDELLASVREIVVPAQQVARRWQRVGERAADLSTVILDEIEEPVLTAVAVARGVKTGTARLLELMSRRVTQRRSLNLNNGDQNDE